MGVRVPNFEPLLFFIWSDGPRTNRQINIYRDRFTSEHRNSLPSVHLMWI